MSGASKRSRRRLVAGVCGAGLVAVAVGGYAGRHELTESSLKFQWRDRHYNAAVMEKALMIAGGNPTEAQKESKEAVTSAEQFAQARTAPSGIVAPGAYSSAFASIQSLTHTGGTWNEVTKVPYNADDTRYRDWYSNSSGGAGYVTGRVTGLAADNAGHVYAAGADGGVWRSSTGGGKWTSIADRLPSLSSGDLALASDSSLWFSTGEANTGGTSYVGAGVYRLANPTTGSFIPTNRVGGKELESTTIGRVRAGSDGQMWAATNRGIWHHSASSPAGAWTFAFAPSPSWMPLIKDDTGKVLVPAGSNWTGNVASGPTNAAYKNIVNDIAVDPKNPKHVVAAIGWRSGDTYNGFYETKDYTKGQWTKLNVVLGAIKDTSDVGYTTFAFSKDGTKLYAMVEQPSKISSASSLMGIYVSKTGSPLGPWNQIANHTQLLHSGSALDRKGYSVGVQAWYNQFLTVDPANADHVWAGLEEVFETKDAGTHWNAVSPYWNFNFPCWNISDAKDTCPLAGHPDQHSVAVGGGKVFFGNDGGVYRRPVNGSVNANGNATDLESMSSDGTLGALQYYSVSVGADKAHGGVVVSGGLQDNGVSNLFSVKTDGTNADPAREMGSNFGGDGADGAADPRNGCNQLQEYVYLSVKVTNNCALNPGAMSEADASSRVLDPNDPNPRFIAPISLDSTVPDDAIMGGQFVYTAKKVWQAQSPADLTKAFDLGSGHQATAVAMQGGAAYASWCGPCNNAGFTRGIATNAGGAGWHQISLPASFPNRFVQGLAIDPSNGKHAYAAVNGFSRRFTEGPGVGLGHVYETRDGGTTWTDISANLPDVPASTIHPLAGGALAVGTDLGAFYRAAGSTQWQVLGTGLPLTVVMQIRSGPDGLLYAATHGRGIWSIRPPA